jgi:PII-like signaling protein
MQLPQDSLLLRIFIGESDRFEGRPLYEAITLHYGWVVQAVTTAQSFATAVVRSCHAFCRRVTRK